MTRTDHVKNFYASLTLLEEHLGHARRLSNCNGRMTWPGRGVYFFMDQGEHRTDSGDGLRIVRVGTHALMTKSKSRLWTRLSQHRGSERSKGGNHRGSVFRLHVGTALIAKEGYKYSSWGQGGKASRTVRDRERQLEMAVSNVIGDMPFLWLAVDDEPGPDSLRGYLERNSIALLSNFGKVPVDPPSPAWLGRQCSSERVRASGLWNSNHVDDSYDPGFLTTMARLTEQMRTAR